MRILAVIHEYPPIGGGAGMILEALSAELGKLGHEMDIVTAAWGDLPRREDRGPIAIHRMPCGRRKQIAPTPWELWSYVRRAPVYALELASRNRYDIIYATCILPGGMVAHRLHRETGLPYVITTSGSDVPRHNPRKFRAMHRLLLPVWRRIVRDSALVTCKSEYLAGRVREAFGGDPGNLAVLPNGIDTSSITPRPLSERDKRILAVGRIEEAKGYQYLVEAIAALHTDYHLEVVGDGPYLSVLRQLAESLGAPVRFHGWLDKSSGRLRELYETSAIFAHPSLAEAFPNVVLEAMLAGLPIVVAAGTGSVEVAGEGCVVVPGGDVAALSLALDRLIASTAMQQQLGTLGRQRAEQRYGWGAVARAYSDAFAGAVACPRLLARGASV